jgi:hypothetical protein
MAWWIPVLQAIGMNAGKNILTGQDPLKGTVEAGITGGITGGFGGDGGLLGGTSGAQVAANPVAGSIADSGMVNIGGTFYNPEYFAGTSLGVPMYTGGEGLLSNVAGDIKSALGDITPQNLLGVASLLDQPDTSQYRQMAGTGGGVSRGSGQGLAVEMPQARVFKRRKA